MLERDFKLERASIIDVTESGEMKGHITKKLSPSSLEAIKTKLNCQPNSSIVLSLGPKYSVVTLKIYFFMMIILVYYIIN